MQQIFNEFIQHKEIIKKLRANSSKELTELELTEINNKVPIPSFEEYSNDKIKRKIQLENNIEKIPPGFYDNYVKQLNVLKSINLDEAYSNFRKNRRELISHYRRKYDEIKHKFRQAILTKKNQEKFLKENLLIIIDDIVRPIMHQVRDGEYVEILKILPKPTEEEYCKAYTNIALLSNHWSDSNWQKGFPTEEEFMNIFKKRYHSFINDIIEIKHFHQLEEFRKKQKEREERHIDKVRRAMFNYLKIALVETYIITEDELENSVKSYLAEIQLKQLKSYIVKNKMNEFYNSFEFEFYCETLSDEDETYYDPDPELHNSSNNESNDSYRWLQDYGDYSYLKNQGLLQDEWDEP